MSFTSGLSKLKNLGARGIFLATLEAFSPENISGLQLWLDATDTDTLNSKMSADFDGASSQYLSSTSPSFTKGNESFSFGAWMSVDTINSCIGNYLTNISFLVYRTSTAWTFVINDGTTGTAVSTTNVKAVGVWQFVVFVYDAENDLLKGSVDGADFVTTAQSTGANPLGVNFRFNVYAASTYGDGRTDGAFFLDRALPLEDVKAMYNAGAGISYQGFLDDLNGNTYALGANFVAASTQYLSSGSTDFDKSGNVDFSFGCWAKMDNTSLDRIINKNGGGGDYGFQVYASGTNFVFFISGDGTAIKEVTSTETYSIDTWYYIVCVHDSVNDLIKISVNGGNFATASHSAGVNNSSINLSLSASTFPLDGVIDGAFFYDKALDLSEVKALYATGNGVTYPSLSALNGDTYAIGQSFNGSTDAFNIDSVLTPLASTTTGYIEMYVKPTTAISTGTFFAVGETNGGDYLAVFNVSGKVRVNIYKSAVTTTQSLTDNVVLSNGTWVKIGVKHDGVNLTIYIDDVEVAQTNSGSSQSHWFVNTPLLDNVRIGSLNYASFGDTTLFDGSIQNVKIWSDSAQTTLVASYAMNNVEGANQVDSINSYDATPIGSPISTTANVDNTTIANIETDLVSYWELNQTDGATMLDSVIASGNDLTNNNNVGSTAGLSTILDTTVANIETDLVSWWELNETSGTRFDEHASNDLTDNNTVGYALGKIQEPIGETKTVADFVSASSEYLSTSDTAFNFGNEDFSFGCWVKFDTLPTTGTNMDIVGKFNSPLGGYLIWVSNASGTIRFNIVIDNGVTQTIKTANVFGTPIINTWYFLNGVYDSVNDLLKISINGNNFETSANSTGSVAVATDFTIGISGVGGARYFDGQISNVFVYNKALSLAEINALKDIRLFGDYSDLSASQKTDLVAWYNLDEASGNRLDSFNPTVDNALSLNGSTDALDTTAVLAPLASTTTGYWECMVKPTTAITGSGTSLISFSLSGVSTNFIMLYKSSTGKIGVTCRLGGVSGILDITTDNVVTADNTWVKVAFFQDGVSPTIYINDVAIAQTNSSSDSTAWFDDFGVFDSGRIGCRAFSVNDSFFDGAIQNVKIWSDSAQTTQVADYNMNETSGTRVDTTGGYDATVIGTPDWISLSTLLKDNNTVGSLEYTAGYVWRWTDKSANAYNFDQDTASAQPQYVSTGFGTESKPYLTLDGVDDFLSTTAIPSTADWTTFVVLQRTVSNAETPILTQDGANGIMTAYVDSTGGTYIQGRTGYALGSTAFNDTETHLLVTKEDAGTLSGKHDGSTTSYGAKTPWTRSGNLTHLGKFSTTYANASIAEVIYYDTALTDAQITQVENYLNNKYGIY